MITIKVYCIDNSELAEYEAVNRGFRGDIYVKVSNKYYHLNIYDIIRLQQDFETELKDYNVFSIEPNIVLVREVNYIEIKKTVVNLYKQNYFEEIRSIEKTKIRKLNLFSI